MNEEYLKELIVGIRVFLWMLSIKIKALSLTEFWKLLEGCSSQQKLYAVWLRYYFRRSDVMKIKEVNTNYILFDNGSRITFDHEQDCCETNYADFEQLEDLALEYEFENDLIFEVVPENGFRFGSKGTPMFFIPCYSDQNGYYSSDIDIFYDGRHVFNVDCEERIY